MKITSLGTHRSYLPLSLKLQDGNSQSNMQCYIGYTHLLHTASGCHSFLFELYLTWRHFGCSYFWLTPGCWAVLGRLGPYSRFVLEGRTLTASEALSSVWESPSFLCLFFLLFLLFCHLFLRFSSCLSDLAVSYCKLTWVDNRIVIEMNRWIKKNINKRSLQRINAALLVKNPQIF